MAGYEVFASFYDRLTENVNYAAWADYLLGLFSRFQGDKPKVLLDLACGSGSLSEQLIARGVDVIGVDGSPEMLMQAQEKSAPFGDKWMLLCQDMRQLDLFGTVNGAVCMLDSLNHLTETRDLEEVFRRLGLFIEPGGLMIFDVNTPYKHQQVLGDQVFVYDEPDFYCVWQNRFLPRRNETEIMRFVGASNGFIQAPFILEGIIAALVGAVLAVAALWVAVEYFIQDWFAESWLRIVTSQDVLMMAPWLLLGAVAVAAIASYVALRRYTKV